MPPAGERVSKWVENTVNSSALVVFSSSTCGFCAKVKRLFKDENIHHCEIVLTNRSDRDEILDSLKSLSGIRTVPQVFARGKFIGDSSAIMNLHEKGQLIAALDNKKFDYDLIVVGGGSGGLAAAKEAAGLGAKVAILDFVKPTPQGTKWGLGGTCVNVGCVPKKLMHNAAILGHSIRDAAGFGWSTGDSGLTHSWATMVGNVQQHIKSLNWGYRSSLAKLGNCDYLNAFGELETANSVKLTNAKGETRTITGDNILLAMGERPRYPGIPGDKEYCITSDDIFSRKCPPGKVLVVGASYVALECAGFLAAVGFDVTVMVRSILLRGFDQQMAEMIGNYMDVEKADPGEDKATKVKFIRECVPTSVTELEAADWKKDNPGLYKVEGKSTNSDKKFEGEFNTVMFAIGRDPAYDKEALTNLRIKLDKAGHVITSDDDCSSLPGVYAIGDIASGRPQLTPMAIKAGRLLARRLYGGSTLLAEYSNVPTTVFTPIEYGACGLSEDKAISQYGDNQIDVYHSNFIPLEWELSELEEKDHSYAKLICTKDGRVVGLHLLGPNAGEITQGFALAMKVGATKADFDRTVGIHPTCAEVFTTLRVTKSSGESSKVTSC